MQENPTASHHHKPVRHASAHRAKPARTAPGAQGAQGAQGTVLPALPYLLVLAGMLAGLLIALSGSRYAGRGMGLAGGTLLAAGLARLVLPPRYAGLLASRHKALDVLTFAVLGGGVLGLALALP